VTVVPELPEITTIAQQMDEKIRGKRVACVEDSQPKNLNIPPQEFAKTARGKVVAAVSCKGKWLFVKLDPAYYMLINLGMGAELLYFKPKQEPPDKFQFKLTFTDGTGFTIHFWWFGYVHLVRQRDLPNHKLTAQLGISPTDKAFTLEHFKALLANKKTGIKSFLLDQKNISGIGNVYIQDTLFRAKMHPNRKIPTLTEKEINSLYKAIKETLNCSIKRGGAAFELDFYGKRGRFTADDFLVGYKTGKPCPECGMTIEKIRTGSTSSYICPKCQKLE
jgi:formamidopyrimidine-DNA glycosylase